MGLRYAIFDYRKRISLNHFKSSCLLKKYRKVLWNSQMAMEFRIMRKDIVKSAYRIHIILIAFKNVIKTEANNNNIIFNSIWFQF